LVLGLALLAVLGCGSGKKYAPVSGKVTLNGQPLANATVNFQPVAPPGSVEVAPGSSGKTNEKGEYTLTVATGEKGAWVGEHRVLISSLDPKVGEGDERPPRGGWPMKDKVPEKYRNDPKHMLTFTVPKGGTDKADFELKSP
jgi:hypothetical protein